MFREAIPTSSDRLATLLLRAFPRLLGAVFIYTAVQKIHDPRGIEAVFRFDGLPEVLIHPTVWTVIGIELSLAVSLLAFIRFQRSILVAAIAVLALFSVQLGYLLIWKEAPDCACLGQIIQYESARRRDLLSLARNICLIVPAIWAWRQLR